jgi:hypothetical protein
LRKFSDAGAFQQIDGVHRHRLPIHNAAVVDTTAAADQAANPGPTGERSSDAVGGVRAPREHTRVSLSSRL